MTRDELKADAELAFVGTKRNISAIGRLTKALGEARTLELAKEYGIEKLFSKEKGKRPDLNDVLDPFVEEANEAAAKIESERAEGPKFHPSVVTSETNGWSRHPRNVEIGADGVERWSKRAIQLQAGTLRLGPVVAAGIAAKCGSTIGAPFPPKAKKGAANG